jgi:signal transduction histidine kinase/DNA-binding response OmpR family regulator
MPPIPADPERNAWQLRRLRLMSAGFFVTYGLLFLLTPADLLGGTSVSRWLHLPQAAILCLHWLWLGRRGRPGDEAEAGSQPGPRPQIEQATVLCWGAALCLSSLWVLQAEADVAPQYALGILVTVMFAAPVARLSVRPTTALLLISGGAVGAAALLRYHGVPPLIVLKDALLVVPGVALAFDAAGRDRLERAEYEARTSLHQAHQALKRAEEARTRLFVNLSHDFRTPLTLIRGEAERLLQEARPAGEEAALRRVGRNADALADLVEQLLELARLDVGAAPCAPVDFALRAVSAEVAAQLQPPTAAVAIVCEEEAAPVPIQVRADRAHVRRILFNLVDNGVRQLRDGGEVRLRARRDGGQVIVDVIDDGPGIPPERLPRIFERFTSFDASGSTASGIGLPLARELAELNGGSLEVAPGAARTTFRLRLPAGREGVETGRLSERGRDFPCSPPGRPGGGQVEVRPLTSPASQSLIEKTPACPARTSGFETGPGRDNEPYLLIVEDHREMAEFLRRALLGWSPVLAHGVEEALRRISERAPRVVVSDVLLGERTGYEVLSALRGAPGLAEVPVVLVSALSDAEQRVRGLHAGADDYLGKPFSEQELRARVAAAVERAEARQAALRAQRDGLLMELHDGVNAALARAAVLLSSRQRGQAEDEEARRGALLAVREALDESTALLSVLEAPQQPFAEAAAELRRQVAEACERHGLRLRFQAGGDGSCGHLRPATGHALRRIAHEALTNVIRHARAREVSLDLEARGWTTRRIRCTSCTCTGVCRPR